MPINQNAAWRIRRNNRRTVQVVDPHPQGATGALIYQRAPVDSVTINELGTGFVSNNSPPSDPVED
jgi:hypothetical protein